jgi:radical SAM superfamily enzyme YgiQ (UPF0313 family)
MGFVPIKPIRKGSMKNNVYFADLTHTVTGMNAPTFPLGISFVHSYAKKMLEEENYAFELFKFPNELAEAITKYPPTILALSNYSWNFDLAYKICNWAKKINPGIISVFGGPNFPVMADEKIYFLESYKDIDFYIEFEGEIGFVNLVCALESHDFCSKTLKATKEKIANCNYLAKNELVSGTASRIQDLEQIPSPYLNGSLDKFFDHPLAPMIETTRGCPFSCSFCADGMKIKSKIKRFDTERTKAELSYISERVHGVDELIITDLNFGMYPDDIKTASYIADIQTDKNYPVIIGASAGKNKHQNVIETAGILKGSWLIGAAIQSSDPQVLKNIKRTNISLDAYQKLSEFNKKLSKDSLTYTEIILGLPGDSKESHFSSLKYGIDNGVDNIRMYQAILLYGTDMATQKTRKEFQISSKFRVIPGSIGNYTFGGENVMVADLEEIIIATKDLSFEDYISCRVMNLIIETFINNSPFEEVFSVMSKLGISTYEIIEKLHKYEEFYPEKVKQIFDSFVHMTKDDLYDSREEADAFLQNPKIIQQYIEGELGVNELLIHKARLYLEYVDIINLLLKVCKNQLNYYGKGTKELFNYLDELCHFLICQKKDFHKIDETINRKFDFDFTNFHEGNLNIENLKPLKKQISVNFFHSKDQKKHIHNSLNLYEDTPAGFGRMIQRSNLKLAYRKFEVVGPSC